MAGVRSKPNPNGKYQGFFKDKTGKPRYFMGTKNKKETLAIANELEEGHQRIRASKSPGAVAYEERPIKDVMEEYLEWGKIQGGRGGRPWGKGHLRGRQEQLPKWRTRLNLERLNDMQGRLGDFNACVQGFINDGKAPKTAMNYAESLVSFFNWCVDMEYLDTNPLARFKRMDATPVAKKRAMTQQEVKRILNAAPTYRRMLYEVAFTTGLRARELRTLTIDDLDMEKCGLVIRAENAKSRKEAFQPLPRRLADDLYRFALNGEPADFYERFFRRKNSDLGEVPENPLLYVSTHPARAFHTDRKKAGVKKKTAEGKVDFHACRTAYINLIQGVGANAKEMQEGARHSDVRVTMQHYARVKNGRQAELTELVAGEIEGAIVADSLQIVAVGAEATTPISLYDKEIVAGSDWWRWRESNL